MKKLLIITVICSTLLLPVTTIADVSVGIGISLPPIVISGPPEVIVLPDTDGVYVCPTIDVDLFFWQGWWWRLYGGGWYRSPYYDRDWVYYSGVPGFYFSVDPYWRTYYHNHNWHGHNWDYQRIPYSHLQSSWRTWDNTRYWQDQKRWNVQGYSPKPQRQQQVIRQQRQELYQSRPEVQQHQQMQREQRQEQQRQPQMQQQHQQMQREQRQEQQRQPQMQQQHQQMQQQRQGESHEQPHGHEGMGEGHRK